MSDAKRIARPTRRYVGKRRALSRRAPRPRKSSPEALMKWFGALSHEDAEALMAAIREIRAEDREAA